MKNKSKAALKSNVQNIRMDLICILDFLNLNPQLVETNINLHLKTYSYLYVNLNLSH